MFSYFPFAYHPIFITDSYCRKLVGSLGLYKIGYVAKFGCCVILTNAQ